jgi:hypothetical protein
MKRCPFCGSRATKLYSLTTGRYTCQVCLQEIRFAHGGSMMIGKAAKTQLIEYAHGGTLTLPPSREKTRCH